MKFITHNGTSIDVKEKPYLKWRPSSYSLTFHDSKLLLCKPVWSDYLELPGGRIELEESPEEAVVRETYEESGYNVNIVESRPFHIGTSYFAIPKWKKYYQSLSIFYICSLKSTIQDPIPHLGKEIEEVFWIDTRKIDLEKIQPYFRDVVKKYLSGETKTL